MTSWANKFGSLFGSQINGLAQQNWTLVKLISKGLKYLIQLVIFIRLIYLEYKIISRLFYGFNLTNLNVYNSV